MKPVIKENERIDYISEYKFIKFVVENSEKEWHEACDFVRKNGLTNGDGLTYWEKEDLIRNAYDYNTVDVYWIVEFFKAHPWIDRMYIVFDD